MKTVTEAVHQLYTHREGCTGPEQGAASVYSFIVAGAARDALPSPTDVSPQHSLLLVPHLTWEFFQKSKHNSIRISYPEMDSTKTFLREQ